MEWRLSKRNYSIYNILNAFPKTTGTNTKTSARNSKYLIFYLTCLRSVKLPYVKTNTHSLTNTSYLINAPFKYAILVSRPGVY